MKQIRKDVSAVDVIKVLSAKRGRRLTHQERFQIAGLAIASVISDPRASKATIARELDDLMEVLDFAKGIINDPSVKTYH